MTAPLTMKQAAEAYGWSYDTFQRGWRALVVAKGFPAPFRERPYLWDPDAVDAWKQRRSEALAASLAGATLKELPPRPAPPATSERRRSRMMGRIRGAA